MRGFISTLHVKLIAKFSCGWYLTKILSIPPDGSVSMKYRKGNATEVVNLNDIKWTTASGRSKWFLPPSQNPQAFSSAHKVKGFADEYSHLQKNTRSRL